MTKDNTYEISDSLWGRVVQYASAVKESWSKDVDTYLDDVMDTDSRSEDEFVGSTVLQDSAHSVALATHLVGSVFSNDYTKERVKELAETIASTPNVRTIITANNTTQADDIIRADEYTQPQSCSLLPADMIYDNRQIAEFDVDEEENKLRDDELYNEFVDSHGYNITLPYKKQTQETQADTLTKEQKTLQDLYPHLYQDKSDEDEMNDQNDYGMER